MCGKKFPFSKYDNVNLSRVFAKQGLKGHMKKHEQITCEVCQKSLQRRELKKHNKFHELIKCETCEKSFAQKRIERHLKVRDLL